MTTIDRGKELLVDLLSSYEDPAEKFSNIYKAKKTSEFGISESSAFITGLTLEMVSEGTYPYDSLKENISNVGSEFICNLPTEGLIEGAYYEINEVCTSTDWETGYCDDTEVNIVRVL